MRYGRGIALCAAIVLSAALGAAYLLGSHALRIVDAWPEPEIGVVALDREGALLRVFANRDGRWRLAVDAEDVDQRFLTMLMAWEDKRFYTHGGVDWLAIGRAAWQSASHGRVVSGGSTLTMQVARLGMGLPARSVPAKARQIALALALESRFSKRDILGYYLRLAPYGGPVEGVRAASLTWFGKEPRRLTAAEAALLVALPQSPERFRPDLHPGRAKQARDRVLARMAALGVLDAAEAERAIHEKLPQTRRQMPLLAAHETGRLRRNNPHATELTLTLAKSVQMQVEDYARQRARELGKHVSLAIMVSDYRTGEVIASVGGPDLFDTARRGYVDLTRAIRSPGSTLKPLIYGLAFERGLAHPESLIDDRPSGFAGYQPQNFDHGFEGVMTVRRALQLSRNLPAVELLRAVGPSRLIHRMRLAGARPELGSRSLPGLAIGLGGLGMTLEDLVRIYGGLANGGVAMPLTIEPRPRKPGGEAILSAAAAWYVTSVLSGAPSTASGSPGSLAFKTGTSYGFRDAWSLGYDGRYVVGVWVGRPDGAPVSGLVGQDAALPILRGVFARLGGAERLAGPPPGVLAASTAGLPPPLRKFGASGGRIAQGAAPEIVFPPAGVRVELGSGKTIGDRDLTLKVRGGQPPYTWYVNGAPVAADAYQREIVWPALQPGFADISVVDAAGMASSSHVFLE